MSDDIIKKIGEKVQKRIESGDFDLNDGIDGMLIARLSFEETLKSGASGEFDPTAVITSMYGNVNNENTFKEDNLVQSLQLELSRITTELAEIINIENEKELRGKVERLFFSIKGYR